MEEGDDVRFLRVRRAGEHPLTLRSDPLIESFFINSWRSPGIQGRFSRGLGSPNLIARRTSIPSDDGSVRAGTEQSDASSFGSLGSSEFRPGLASNDARVSVLAERPILQCRLCVDARSSRSL